MNLTKGKITKLYNKKRQTLKRKINKKKSSNKSKTFRRNRKINLARKSLKRFHNKKYRGGIGEGEERKDAMDVEKTGEGEGVKLDDITLEEEKNGEDAIEADGQNATTGEGNNVDANKGQEVALTDSKRDETKNEIVGDALSGDTNPKFASDDVVALENAIEPVTGTTQSAISVTEAETAIPVTEAEIKAAAEEAKEAVTDSKRDEIVDEIVDGAINTTTTEPEFASPNVVALENAVVPEAEVPVKEATIPEAQVTEATIPEAQAKAQAEQKAKEEAEARAKEEAEARAKEEAQKQAAEEAEQKQAEQTQTQVVEAAQPQTQVVEAQVPVTQVTTPPEKGPKPNLSNMSVPSDMSLPPDQQNDKLTQAIDTVVDYIADKVSKKVTINVSSSDYTPQNGYEAVKTAAETMASSKGGKKRKTRKFKLTKKNKTRSRT
jgi:hypothetical protein